MFGLIVLVVGVIYLVVLIAVTRMAFVGAKRRGYSRAKCWLAAAVGFLIVYLPIFWDHIPTHVANQYYCSTQAGFNAYKTVEQWKKENPGVIEGLSRTPSEQFSDKTKKHHLLPDGIKLDVSDKTQKHYLLPDGTKLVAYYNVIGEFMFVTFSKPDGTTGDWLNQRFVSVTNRRLPVPMLSTQISERVIVDTKNDQVLARHVSVASGPGGRDRRELKFWLQGGCLSKDDEFWQFVTEIKKLGEKR